MVDDITNSMDVSLGKLRERCRTGKPGVLQSMGSQSDMTERLNNSKTDRRSSTSSNGGAAPIRHTHLQITVRV